MKKLVLLLLILVPSNAISEPSKSVSYLMNDSITMLDWGLYRIEKSLDSMEFSELDLVSRSRGRAVYDWNSNRINLTVVIYTSYSSLQKTGAKQICKTGLLALKRSFGYGFKTELRSIFGIESYFKHRGFVRNDKPKTLGNDLENITKLTITVYASKTNKPIFSAQTTCASKLLENNIYFVDE